MQTVQVAHGVTVIPHYTKAHTGNPGNEAADMDSGSDCKLAQVPAHAAMDRFPIVVTPRK